MTLIERLEAASGPSFVLDNEIADTIWRLRWGKKRPKDIRADPFTANLGAALSLVPHDSLYHISGGGKLRAFVTIESGDDRVEDFRGTAETPALALCIAALRAQEVDRG